VAVVRALAALGPEAAGAVPALSAVLENGAEDAFLRSWVAEALGRIGPEALSAVPPLVAALRGDSPGIKDAALRALPAITGQSFGDDVSRWTQWWEENKP
jgi:HEAT repeat protein